MTFRLKTPVSVFIVDSFAQHLWLSSTRIHAKHSSSHTCFLHTCHSLPELSSTRQRLNTKAGNCLNQNPRVCKPGLLLSQEWSMRGRVLTGLAQLGASMPESSNPTPQHKHKGLRKHSGSGTKPTQEKFNK